MYVFEFLYLATVIPVRQTSGSSSHPVDCKNISLVTKHKHMHVSNLNGIELYTV